MQKNKTLLRIIWIPAYLICSFILGWGIYALLVNIGVPFFYNGRGELIRTFIISMWASGVIIFFPALYFVKKNKDKVLSIINIVIFVLFLFPVFPVLMLFGWGLLQNLIDIFR